MLSILSAAIFLGNGSRQAVPPFPFQDPHLSAKVRAKDFVSRLTVEEQIAQCMMDTPGIPRFGVPPYHWWNEALHGIARNGYATVFPQAIGLAATWDVPLHHQVATIISTEARAKYEQAQREHNYSIYTGLTLWSPNVNIFRDPRWGRGQETYGEDPFLTGSLGVAFVKGIQGDDPSYLRAVATPKHFAVHSGPEPLRHRFDATVTEREIRETYLPQFEMCVREGHAQSVMSAYSGFNGIPCTGDSNLLTKILRDEWGFDGAVVSDVDSVHDIWADHHFVKDAAEASALAIKAGDDSCSGDTYRALPEALQRGLVSKEDIAKAATRLFTLRFRLGMFDGPKQVAYLRTPFSENDSPAHSAAALKVAHKAMTLLKNDGLLPLNPSLVHRVAVLGPVADSQSVLVGNYNGEPSHPVTLQKGIREAFEAKGIHVDSDEGCVLAEGLDEGQDSFLDGMLFTDSSLKASGLKREVFDTKNLEGTPISTTVDQNVNLVWDETALPGIPKTNCSIRWTGVLVAPYSGAATLGVSVDDGARLYIDDQLVIDDWKEGANRSHLAKVNWVKGQSYKVRLEFFQAENQANIRFGFTDPNVNEHRIARAVALAKNADAVILTLGITPDLEGEEMGVNLAGFKGGDRTSLDLPSSQRELLQSVALTGKPIIVVLTGGSALSLDTQKANSILMAWYPGQRGGDAVADVLLGAYNPAGRLPVTFYRSVNDLPPFEDYHMAGRTYRYFAGKPLFAFGHGLSYTRFEYGKPTAPASVKASGTVPIRLSVSNVGSRNGEEVVQVYARQLSPTVPQAIHQLVGFARIPVVAGKKAPVEFQIPTQRLRIWDSEKHRYVVLPGKYEFQIGAASDDIRQRVTVRVR